MPDFLIDPELRIRASPPIVLRRTTEAVEFIRQLALSGADRAWEDALQSFEAAVDEWSAMEAVVRLELLLEAGDLLIEKSTAYVSRSGQGQSRAA
jgi:acyl-CoA reductase-like NAD-dependent aldehyde dehydrogenase